MQNTCVYEHFVLAPALPQHWGSVTSSRALKNERLFRNVLIVNALALGQTVMLYLNLNSAHKQFILFISQVWL